MRTSLPVSVLVLCFAGCKPTLNGPCDAKQMDALRKATPNMHPEDRALITTQGLVVACGDKLPSGITKTLEAVIEAAPLTAPPSSWGA